MYGNGLVTFNYNFAAFSHYTMCTIYFHLFKKINEIGENYRFFRIVNLNFILQIILYYTLCGAV